MSGKRAKLLRKNKRFSKKAFAMGLGLCMGAVPAVADSDFLISLYPNISKPLDLGYTNEMIQSGLGGGAKFTWRPADYLNVFAYGDYYSLALQNVDPITMLSGGLGTGYHLGITDNIAMDFNMQVGAYTAKATSRLSGLTGGVSLTFTYRINPVVSVDVNGSGSHYASGSRPLMTLNASVSPGLTINLTELFSNKTKIDMNSQELAPVFPVLYSWYENNSFGKVTIKNQEDSSITDITVSFYQPQYMGNPKECGKIKKLGKGETVDVDLYAFFNEQMLELTEKTDTQASVIVSYSCLGQKRTQKFALTLPVYGRNNMSWDDDRRAAVFVSSKDPAAMLFAKYITSIVRDNVRSGVPGNIQYAMGIFEALDQFGLSYVIDPSSAFEDNVGTSSIDFLQFPYQTLMYRGGDCDDLSILVCSLFEAVGIRTAFITIPGHIYMAFDSGLTVNQAKFALSDLSEMIIDGDEVWVPLEITLSDEGFYKSWKVGAREWNTAQRAGTAAMYKMEDSWKLYAPVSVPGATAFFTMPDQNIVAKLFDHSVDQWITKQIEPQIAMYEAKLKVKDDVKTRNSLGILYGKYGLFVQADEQFKKARRQGYQPSVLNTGNVYFSMKDYTRARKWYKQVLKDEPDNVLALIGVARCSYELSDYKECDAAYDRAMALDFELAKEYAYLGTFVSSKGRAFSLADRLENTIWSEEKEEVIQAVKDAVESTADEDSLLIKDEPLNNDALKDLMDFNIEAYALVSAESEKEEEDEDLENYDIASAGDGDPEPDTVLAEDPEVSPETEIADVEIEAEEKAFAEEELDLSVFTENFTGLLSEVALDVNDYIYEDIDDVEVPSAVAPVAVVPVVPVPAPVAVAPATPAATPVAPVTPAPVVPAVEPVTPLAAEPSVVVAEAPVTVAAIETETAAEVSETEPVAVQSTPAVTETYVTKADITEANVAEADTAETAPVIESHEELAIETAELATVESVAAAEPAVVESVAVAEPVAIEPVTVEPVAAEPVITEPAAVAVTSIPAAPVIVEIIPMEVPRFTEQPSAQWAPEEAYVAETIPGMKSFEEEMGEYQNEKAFLYEDTVLLDTDPDNDIDKPELQQNSEQFASAGIPDVNPFSSYLSEEEAKEVEKITNYSIEEVRKEAGLPEKAPEKIQIKQVETVTEKPVIETTIVETVTAAPVAETQIETTATEATVTETPVVETKTETPVVETPVTEKITAAPVEDTAAPSVVEKTAEVKTSTVEKSTTADAKTSAAVETKSSPVKTSSAAETAAVVESVPVVEKSETEIETKQEIKNNENKEKSVPKGLLVIASIAAAAGAAGIVTFKKLKQKKDEK